MCFRTTLIVLDYEVLYSPSGYYIGRMCYEKGDDFPQPYDRASGYYDSFEEAKKDLWRFKERAV